MARLISPGRSFTFAYLSEKRVAELLRDSLPDTYILDWNRTLPIGKNKESRELDIILLAPHAIYIIEVKNWQGIISGDRDKWELHNSATGKSETKNNPLKSTRFNAQSTKTSLVEAIPTLNGILWVEYLVVLAHSQASIGTLPEDVRHQICTMQTLITRVSDPSQIRGPIRQADLQPFYKQIESILVGDTSSAPRLDVPTRTRTPAPTARPIRSPASTQRKSSPTAAISVVMIILLLLICWQGYRWTSSALTIPSPTPGLTTTAGEAVRAAPTVLRSTRTSTPEDKTVIRQGSTVVVVNTSIGLRGRAEPAIRQDNVIVTFNEGDRLQVLEGPVQAEEHTWWKVQNDAGIAAWCAAGEDGTAWLQLAQN